MGAWGVGLYSSDFALDMRGCVDAVVRLPFDAEALLETIRQTEPASADDPADPDHTVFWLTVAERLARKGVDCPAARERALAIIDGGTDLAAMAALGMDATSLAKRRAMLEALRQRLATPVASEKRRGVLKAPQKLLAEVGEVLIYPVCREGARCQPINPYAVGKDWAWVKAWKQDGWGAVVVAERGLLFEFLAWYRPLVAWQALPGEPTLAELKTPRAWTLEQAGTLSARHYANLQLKSVGRVTLDPARLEHFFPGRRMPLGPVVADISIANALGCHERSPEGDFWDMTGERFRPGLRALADLEGGDDGPGNLDLSGSWRGEYSETGQDDPPRSFSADLTEIGGLVRGAIEEDATAADKPGRPLQAVLEGRLAGRAVRLIKRYESATKRFMPILYEGEIDAGGQRIAGHWSLRTGACGHFAMSRATQAGG